MTRSRILSMTAERFFSTSVLRVSTCFSVSLSMVAWESLVCDLCCFITTMMYECEYACNEVAGDDEKNVPRTQTR